MDTHDIGIQNSNQIPHICGLNPNVAALQAPDIAAWRFLHRAPVSLG